MLKISDHPLMWLTASSDNSSIDPDHSSSIENWFHLTENPKAVMSSKIWGLTIWGTYLLMCRYNELSKGAYTQPKDRFYIKYLAPHRDLVLKHPAFWKGMPAIAFILAEGRHFLQDWIDRVEGYMTRTEFGYAVRAAVPLLNEVKDVDLSLSHGNLSLLNCVSLLRLSFQMNQLAEIETEILNFYGKFLQSPRAKGTHRLLAHRSHLRVHSHLKAFETAQFIRSLRGGTATAPLTSSSPMLKRIKDTRGYRYGLHYGTAFNAYLLYRLSLQPGNEHLHHDAWTLLDRAEKQCQRQHAQLSQADSFLESPLSVGLTNRYFFNEVGEDWDFVAGLFASKEFFKRFGLQN